MALVPRAPLLADLFRSYSRAVLPLRGGKTRYEMASLFRRWTDECGGLLLAEVTPARLGAWRDGWLADGYTPHSVRHFLQVLQQVFAWGVTRHWLAVNPMQTVTKPLPPPRRMRYLTPAEWTRLLEAVQYTTNRHLPLLVHLALSTGARKHTLLALRQRDVDQDAQALCLGDRWVPCPPAVWALLHVYLAPDAPPDAWLFPRSDGRGPVVIEHAWRETCGRARLRDLWFDDLRQASRNYLAWVGTPLAQIETILGATLGYLPRCQVSAVDARVCQSLARMLRDQGLRLLALGLLGLGG